MSGPVSNDPDAQIPSVRFHWSLGLMVLCAWLEDVAESFAGFFEAVKHLAGAGYNYRVDRDTFHEAAAREIESLGSSEE